MSLTVIITAGDRKNGTDFHTCGGMVGAIEMSSYRFVGIIVSGQTKMFSKPVEEASADFTDINFRTFVACDAINDITRYT